jgi:hypothetical protein
MKVIFTWSELIVMNSYTEIARYKANCKVRQELNGQRSKGEVQYTVTKHPKPYYPRQFPSGIFKITDIEYTDNIEYAPVKIKTNATREVFTWDLNRDGNYWKPTGKTQIDTAYWLHYTDSSTTLGCIRIGSAKDALSLAHIIEPFLENNDSVLLEVL